MKNIDSKLFLNRAINILFLQQILASFIFFEVNLSSTSNSTTFYYYNLFLKLVVLQRIKNTIAYNAL